MTEPTLRVHEQTPPNAEPNTSSTENNESTTSNARDSAYIDMRDVIADAVNHTAEVRCFCNCFIYQMFSTQFRFRTIKMILEEHLQNLIRTLLVDLLIFISSA